MKKIIPVIIGVVVLLVLGAGIFLWQANRKVVPLETLLPEQPVGYVRQTQLSKGLEEFAGTRFYQDLQAINVENAIEKIGAGPEGAARYKKLKQTLFSGENQQLVKQLLGKEFVVAAYPDDSLKNFQPKDSEEMTMIAMQMAQNIFVVSRISPELQVAEFVSKFFLQYQEELSSRTSQYRGKTITVLSTKDGIINIGYFRMKDILVVGLGEKAARAAIDTLARSRKSLAQDPVFLKSRAAFLPGAESAAYVDFQAFFKLINEGIKQWMAGQKDIPSGYEERFQEELKQIAGMQMVTYSGKTGPVHAVKMDIHFDKNALHPDVKPFYTCPPDSNKTLNFVPSDTLFYNWNTCVDVKEIWKRFIADLEREAELGGHRASPPSRMVAALEQQLGMSFEKEILPALGREFGFYLTDLDIRGVFPIPEIVFLIHVTEKAGAEAVLNKLLALQPMLRPEQEQYADAAISYIAVPMLEELEPAYTFLGNYLLIATNRAALKGALDTARDPGKSLISAAGFQEVNFGLMDKNNSIVFMQVDRAVEKAQSLVDWMITSGDKATVQQEAFKSGSNQRLKDIQDSIARDKETLAGLKDQLTKFSTPAPAEAVGRSAQIDEVKKRIEETERSLKTNEERKEELQAILGEFEMMEPELEKNKFLIDELVRPFLKAVSHFKGVSSRSVTGEGVMESFNYFKLE